VTISGIVAPESIVFNNNSKTYIINGDSIAGSPSLTKNGSGQTILNNVNHLGNTIINDGTLTVASLANTSGTDYGSLGSISSTLTINGGATFGVNTTATSDQPMRLGSGGGAISVSSGKTLTQSAALSGSGQTLTKKGAGTLSLPAALSLKRLVISQGTVTASEANSITSLPETVEFQGGTLKDPVNIYSYTTNNANFEVPEGKTGTFYGDARCNYKGKLTGAGTFNVYATSVRGYFQGDWSAFEGTVTANTFKSDSYDPAFIFDNSYGLPKAMLRISSGVTFDNNGRSMSIGSVSGTGQLGGSGTYTIGTNNSNITVTFGSQSPIVKEGTGTMIATSPGLLTKTVTLNNGKLVFDATNGTNIFGGALTANTGTEVIGEGAIGAMTLNDGAQVSPRSTLLEDAFGVDVMPGVIKASASVNFKQGSVLNIYIDGADSYSSIQPRFLTMNGTVKVVFLDGYQPSVGDEFVVWEAAQTFSGTPTVELPELPQGLEWDTSDLKAKHGVLRIKEAETEGVSLTTSVEATCQVFTPSGVCVATMNAARDSIREKVQQAGLPQGTYIVVINTGNRTETTKVVVR
jgi:autotransporter-associated beta strand protein